MVSRIWPISNPPETQIIGSKCCAIFVLFSNAVQLPSQCASLTLKHSFSCTLKLPSNIGYGPIMVGFPLFKDSLRVEVFVLDDNTRFASRPQGLGLIQGVGRGSCHFPLHTNPNWRSPPRFCCVLGQKVCHFLCTPVLWAKSTCQNREGTPQQTWVVPQKMPEAYPHFKPTCSLGPPMGIVPTLQTPSGELGSCWQTCHSIYPVSVRGWHQLTSHSKNSGHLEYGLELANTYI